MMLSENSASENAPVAVEAPSQNLQKDASSNTLQDNLAIPSRRGRAHKPYPTSWPRAYASPNYSFAFCLPGDEFAGSAMHLFGHSRKGEYPGPYQIPYARPFKKQKTTNFDLRSSDQGARTSRPLLRQ